VQVQAAGCSVAKGFELLCGAGLPERIPESFRSFECFGLRRGGDAV
jgi:hypothetical protein